MEHERFIKNISDDLETLYKEDITLYYGLLKRIEKDYDTAKFQEKRKICEERGYHDYSEWEGKKETVMKQDQDDFGEPWYYTSLETVYYRKCNYCGEFEKVYSKEKRDELTEKNNAKKLSLNK